MALHIASLEDARSAMQKVGKLEMALCAGGYVLAEHVLGELSAQVDALQGAVEGWCQTQEEPAAAMALARGLFWQFDVTGQWLGGDNMGVAGGQALN